MNICQNLSQRVITPSLTWCNERGRACVRVERGKTCVKLYHAKRKSRQSKTLSYLSLNFLITNDYLFIFTFFDKINSSGGSKSNEQSCTINAKMKRNNKKITYIKDYFIYIKQKLISNIVI